jgi:hypothetical protein
MADTHGAHSRGTWQKSADVGDSVSCLPLNACFDPHARATTSAPAATSKAGLGPQQQQSLNEHRQPKLPLLPARVTRGLDDLMLPLVKSTLFKQPRYPREHLLQLLESEQQRGGAAGFRGASALQLKPAATEGGQSSPTSRVRAKVLQYRDEKVDPLLLPALTKLFCSMRMEESKEVTSADARPIIRSGLLPQRSRNINKKALKKVGARWYAREQV